jgi:hypothetical protein
MSSLRMPQNLVARLKPEAGDAVLHYELMQEQAYSMGRAGRKVEAALAALREHPGGEGRAALLKDAADAVWAALLKDAADAVWGFLVQREVMGLRDRNQVIAQYAIPKEVLARLGAR